ncbi:Glycosyltransferase involved in cell wall bisynthesis [Kaistia soli DSM 19436]|uniref:Glycosyltransferase involved in cell wall bisynthesis n=1 Tax=Kaistia soli DSM 19436 TaxID=1122133 RepID=A0A1M5H1H3_9HYPH|nr:glycosyltransferase family A protein [Kaistia soli]SHG09891.1 Glycosyltransferase involved in cell wall bisynthesis [Kaistia soli DSM 19436]
MAETGDEAAALVSQSGRFDAGWYGRLRPHLNGDTEALADYLRHGWLAGLSPSARFDPAAYRAANPDVGEVDPLLHYAREGLQQGRRLKPDTGDAGARDGISMSIILPTRDRGWIVEEAIHSVLVQTHRRFELIVVDDGSNDGTAAQLHERHADDLAEGRIVLIELPEPRGVCYARNVGLAAARYPWIAYVDSDNLVEPHFLETFADGILAHPEAQCFYAEFYHQGNRHHLGQPFDRALLRASNYIDLGAFVHHRDCVGRYAGFDEALRRLVDWDLILSYTRDVSPVFLDEQVMLYREIGGEGRITWAEPLEIALAYVRAKHDIRPEEYASPAKLEADPGPPHPSL